MLRINMESSVMEPSQQQALRCLPHIFRIRHDMILSLLFCSAWLAALAVANRPELANEVEIPEVVAGEVVKMQWSAFGTPRASKPSAQAGKKEETVRVTTPLGDATGVVKTTCSRNIPYAAFFGLPYAKPPVGPLRFQAPLEAGPWDGVWNATFERPSCLQFNGDKEESEDCLYVNVYTPNFRSQSNPLPVMVFIHGGAFIGGSSSSSIYAPDFLVEKGVVLVTFNYRLGPLGFMSFQNERVPGNAGLKDQNLALRWVRGNIASLGGDPGKVTIFGESAGSASVNYHIFSKASEGLFHGAIMQSGVVTSPWAYVPAEKSLKNARSLAEKVGCIKSDSATDEIIDCMMEAPARSLTDNQEGFLSLEDIVASRPFAFVPTSEPDVEGAFLTGVPMNILYGGNYSTVPTMIGTNSREGLIVLPVLKKVDPLGIGITALGTNLGAFVPFQLVGDALKTVHEVIKKFYFGNRPVSIFTRDLLLNLLTDLEFTMPAQHVAAFFANSSHPVYNYLFTYDGSYAFYKSRIGLKGESGVCHGDELGYLFYDPAIHPCGRARGAKKVDRDAERMVDAVTNLWTNFAKFGDPTPRKSSTVKWEPFTEAEYKYMNIGKNLVLEDAPLKHKMDFWYNLVLEFVKL